MTIYFWHPDLDFNNIGLLNDSQGEKHAVIHISTPVLPLTTSRKLSLDSYSGKFATIEFYPDFYIPINVSLYIHKIQKSLSASIHVRVWDQSVSQVAKLC